MELYNKLKQFGSVRVQEPLSKHTTFKIGGPCDFFITVDETETLVSLLRYLDGEGVNYIVFGGGSNMLVSDEGFRGVVIKIHNSEFRIVNDTLEAEAGCITAQMAQESIKAGLTGFEWGVGVPGTIGGAVHGNAGAMEGEMKDVVAWVDVYRDAEVIRVPAEECQFSYRDSLFKTNVDVVLCVGLSLQKRSSDTVLAQGALVDGRKKALEHLQYRNKTQPQGWASTGCIFKNVPFSVFNFKNLSENDVPQRFLDEKKISAGWLVEQVRMKGVRAGNAQVSEKHGNFIVNLRGATAQDVQTLIEQIKTRVYDTYGIELEEEIQSIGFRG